MVLQTGFEEFCQHVCWNINCNCSKLPQRNPTNLTRLNMLASMMSETTSLLVTLSMMCCSPLLLSHLPVWKTNWSQPWLADFMIVSKEVTLLPSYNACYWCWPRTRRGRHLAIFLNGSHQIQSLLSRGHLPMIAWYWRTECEWPNLL